MFTVFRNVYLEDKKINILMFVTQSYDNSLNPFEVAGYPPHEGIVLYVPTIKYIEHIRSLSNERIKYEKQQTIDVNSKGVECNICPMPPPTNQKDGIFARPNQS
jgi:hypothetical protein